MEQLTDLKAILHSKRANLYYLEHCRVMQKDGRVLYLTESKQAHQYWNIPIANTTVLLLGTGTSITQAAMRMLTSAGVLVGFCGSGATPLFSGTEVEWLTPQNEYRPTAYVQGWLKFWFDATQRLNVAKQFQLARIDYLNRVWQKDRDLHDNGFYADELEIERILQSFRKKIDQSPDVKDLLINAEAPATKSLYRLAAKLTGYGKFSRQHEEPDQANQFLNHGNYLAYGLAACALWVLGIPHGFAVMHGKTRRGALVFDVADLIKDALVLPWAFIAAKENLTEQEFRQQLLQKFTEHQALDYLFNTVKHHALANINDTNIEEDASL
ncbi:type I-F CRISPR-associated endonuclease Cas1f [Neisseriaceae bacterium ESL0693]|nr:type I-F CRISPR-associated endonuclease Cas1f [Neisseriaceae bacterium ESL0693]